MKKFLKKNQKISMVPQNIKGALSTTIKDFTNTSLEVEITAEDFEYYSKGDSVEMFTIVEDGMLYFKPIVADTDSETNTIKVQFESDAYELLQRREYTRIDFEKEFTLSDNENEYICKCIDISAGGMKFVTTAPLNTASDYKIEFTLENSIPIKCYFKPIRVVPVKGNQQQNIVSGRFLAIKNIDKIAIVQFCFKKNMESVNK